MPVPARRTLRCRPLALAALPAGLLLLGGCVSLHVPTSPAPPVDISGLTTDQARHTRLNQRVFDTVWDQINRRYFDPAFNGLDWKQMAREYGPQAADAPDSDALYDVLNDMLGRLNDPHTAAIEPKLLREEETGEREAVGIRLQRFGDQWAVAEVLPGGTAAAAGVQPGWIAVSRDGVKLDDSYQSPDQTEGETVHWEFLDRQGTRVTLDLTVHPVPFTVREEREFPDGIVYLRFDGFDLGNTHWLSDRLAAHRKAPGVVIDLRENSGGLVASALFAVGEFFDQAVPVFVTLDQEGERYRWASLMLGSAHYHGRVAVLVDDGTASASEILAASLQEKNRATIVGRKTAGALLTAWRIGLPDGGVLQYSHDDVITMGGRHLENDGLEPDVEVRERTLADLQADRDPDLDAALQVLRQP